MSESRSFSAQLLRDYPGEDALFDIFDESGRVVLSIEEAELRALLPNLPADTKAIEVTFVY